MFLKTRTSPPPLPPLPPYVCCRSRSGLRLPFWSSSLEWYCAYPKPPARYGETSAGMHFEAQTRLEVEEGEVANSGGQFGFDVAEWGGGESEMRIFARRADRSWHSASYRG